MIEINPQEVTPLKNIIDIHIVDKAATALVELVNCILENDKNSHL